jgi:hypothetical protein
MQDATTTPVQEGTMFATPNQDTLQGRMLAGLLAAESNRNARMLLTVELQGARHYQQTYRAKAWTAKDGTRMLTLDLNDGDWAQGTYATKVLHVNTAAGTALPAKGMGDDLLVYAARAAVQWAFTGTAPQPGNGSVAVTAAQLCGCCGRELTHPVSKDLGIGPECAKKLGLEHHYKGTTLTSARKASVAKAAEKQGAAPAAPAPAAAPAVDVDGQLAEWEEANQDALAALDPQARAAALAKASTALLAGDNPAWLAPAAPVQHRPIEDIERSLAHAHACHPRTMDSIHDLVQAEALIKQYQDELAAAKAASVVNAPCLHCHATPNMTCGYCDSTGYRDLNIEGMPAASIEVLRAQAAHCTQLAKLATAASDEGQVLALDEQLGLAMAELGTSYAAHRRPVLAATA